MQNDKNKDLNNLEKEMLQEMEAEIQGFSGEEKEKLKEELRKKIKQEIKNKQSSGAIYRTKKEEVINKIEEPEEEFERFSILFRIQHIILFTSVIILIITGIPLKFPESFIANFVFNYLMSLQFAGVLHRFGAFLLIVFFLYNLVWVIFTKDGRYNFIYLLPRPKDIFDAVKNIKYFLGLEKEGAKFERFSYIEKFDYWAVYWGCVIMIGSGLILWMHNFAMRILPKFVLDMAKEAHSDEGLLATLAVVIWHFYNVHFNPDRFPGSLMWLHGKIKKSEIIKEHPMEYERIKIERLKD